MGLYILKFKESTYIYLINHEGQTHSVTMDRETAVDWLKDLGYKPESNDPDEHIYSKSYPHPFEDSISEMFINPIELIERVN